MKIVVTGGAGYIGCRLIEQLLKNSINHRKFIKNHTDFQNYANRVDLLIKENLV